MVGQTTAEINGQSVLQLEFYDYLLQPINPQELTLTTFQQYIWNGEEVRITYGTSQSARTHIKVNISQNVLTGIADDAYNSPIRSLSNIILDKLTTTDKEYTKFKFIQ